MKLLAPLVAQILLALAAQIPPPRPGSPNHHRAEAARVGRDRAGGRIYISETGEYEKANDGYISVLESGKLRRFADGLDDPHGIKWWRDRLFVSDNMGMIWRIDAQVGS